MNSRRDHYPDGKAEFDAESLLLLAKTGDGAAVGRLLERYRNYIGLLIRLRGRRLLRKSRDADELLQEIGLEIRRRIATFRGTSVREFLVWVRRMIGSILASRIRQHIPEAERRDPPGRRPIDGPVRSSRARGRSSSAHPNIPGQPPVRHEQAVVLADALDRLPEDYREVIILRHLEGLGFPEVARRMGRTEDSAKNLWLRALAQLRRTLEEHG
jgi:RNA polymerase sigma-70 factor (ECF subfamily)